MASLDTYARRRGCVARRCLGLRHTRSVDRASAGRTTPARGVWTWLVLFTAADVDEDVYRFGVSDAAPLPDGTVVVSYDLAAEAAGDDQTPRRQRLAILGDDGVLAPIELPELDGATVGSDASLLATAADGTMYLWDHEPERVVALSPTGACGGCCRSNSP